VAKIHFHMTLPRKTPVKISVQTMGKIPRVRELGFYQELAIFLKRAILSGEVSDPSAVLRPFFTLVMRSVIFGWVEKIPPDSRL